MSTGLSWRVARALRRMWGVTPEVRRQWFKGEVTRKYVDDNGKYCIDIKASGDAQPFFVVTRAVDPGLVKVIEEEIKPFAISVARSLPLFITRH